MLVAGTDAAELESWVRQELGLAPDATVAIAEKPGTDPRCADMVTEVEITPPGEAIYSFHIERPMAEMVRMDLIAALAFGGAH